ncbi:hypothetical protein DL93DRAFT_2226192 [Clavulina sp. PMI_390]|nr:hypothetical protein DL93DRAFT_2226192 [Clavulina sp. PMI_390]
MLAKGTACLQCRRHKVKCNGVRPICSRCRHLHKKCEPAVAISRRRPLAELEARALGLEIRVHKLAVSRLHDLSLTSTRLLDRVARIGSRGRQQPADATWLPMYPHFEDLAPALRTSTQVGQLLLGREVTEGYSPLIHRSAVERALDSCQWDEGDHGDVSPIASRYLISLFLPHRSRFHFFMDVPYFLNCLSLPSSHPESIHPCLRYACYLAASIMTGGRLTLLQPYMLARTRHFLDQSLMFADRLPHFLWGSMILASYMVGRARRLEEAFAIVSSAARFASACGLTRNPIADPGYDYLLPPPRDKAEADDRARLARSIYLTDQILSTLSGFHPTFLCSSKDHELQDAAYSEPLDTRSSMMLLKVSTVNLFENVTGFARSVYARQPSAAGKSHDSLTSQLTSIKSSIPSLAGAPGLGEFEAVTTSRPHIFLAHVTVYGSAIVLYSLQASKDSEARREMLRNVQSLANICEKFRGPNRSNLIQASLPSMRHIMNAVRVLAHELRAPEAIESPRLSIHYCKTIEFLLDFLDNLTISYPAWVDAPTPLADVIVPAVTALNI